MTTQAWVWLVATLCVAAIDWLAVSRLGNNHGGPWQRVRYVAKPLTMLLLCAAALSLEPAAGLDGRRWWFVAAILLGMAGDIFLMLPNEDLFIGGLLSFFVGHLTYLIGFQVHGPALGRVIVIALLLAVVAAVIGRRVLAGAVAGGHRELRVPIVAYMAVLVSMAAWAAATGNPWAVAGGLLFLASDATLSWNRFVQPSGWAPLTVIVTYHVAQICLVLSLLKG